MLTPSPAPHSRRAGTTPRRVLLWVSATLLAVAVACLPCTGMAFDMNDVVKRATALAAQPYAEPKQTVPEWLRNITYDQWRDIRFRPDKALWLDRGTPFQVQFFHPGLFYHHAIAVNVVESDGVKPVAFSPSQFDYGDNDFASRIPQDLGYAGFRIHAPIKTAKYYDEVAVFLGATYFRAVGKDNGFGLSARGLAIDTALPGGEEFPAFTEFWLVAPTKTAKELTVYALLDSASVTGAYQFVIQPGVQTTVAVTSRLFMRRDVKKLGIGALTSMFFYGENTPRHFDDFRPEVHDSDGLLLNFNNGEWLWRPLDNPPALNVSAFFMTNPKGFGLLQRDRDFERYQDLETRAELRPSAWIVPKGDWGNGHVELVEIPTKSDHNDNIVAFWVPEEPPKAGESALFAYTMAWYSDDPQRPPGGRVAATRRDRKNTEDLHRFVIDFAGKRLSAIPADQVLRGAVSVAADTEAAEVLGQHVVKNPVTGAWRLTFEVKPKRREPLELRAFLDKGGEALTETWSYVILP